MVVVSKVSCGARIPTGKKVTAVHLFAEEQVKTWWLLWNQCCLALTMTMCASLPPGRDQPACCIVR